MGTKLPKGLVPLFFNSREPSHQNISTSHAAFYPSVLDQYVRARPFQMTAFYALAVKGGPPNMLHP